MKRLYVMPIGRANAIKAVQEAHDGQVVTVSDPTRSGEQNNLLHALLTEVAARMEWAGKRHDVETWKRLLVSAWCRAEGKQMEILPALDGHGVDIVPARTSKLSKSECTSLIDYVHCWMAENEVEA